MGRPPPGGIIPDRPCGVAGRQTLEVEKTASTWEGGVGCHGSRARQRFGTAPAAGRGHVDPSVASPEAGQGRQRSARCIAVSTLHSLHRGNGANKWLSSRA